MNYPLYRQLSLLIGARQNCIRLGNDKYLNIHTERVRKLCDDMLPSGSGIDCGTKIDIDAGTEDKLVFAFSYHHMNDGGLYDGWSNFKAIVTPSLGFEYKLRIVGSNRNDIKDYLHETFAFALDQIVDPEKAVS